MTRPNRRGFMAGAAVAASAPAAPAPKIFRLTREVPVEGGYDVLVAGGGPAGAAAAICAARLGAKVLLAEGTGCLGGMATSGMMMSFCPTSDGERRLTRGLMLELIETLHRRGFLRPNLPPDTWHKRFGSWIQFNAEGLKLLLDELAVEAGAEVRFFTNVIDADADARRGAVSDVLLHNIEGYHFNLDALREKSMTDGMMAGRRLAQEYLAFYRKYVPGCENVEHVVTAPLMGLRESRCVRGEYELNVADYQARRHFPDQIGVYNYPIDIHVYDVSDGEYQRYYKEFHETGRPKRCESVGLPYGMVVAKGWRNLWVAGRCASMDVPVHGAFRVQPAAVMMGQAAGTAAWQSVRTGRPAAEIDTEVLVETLRKAGAYLPQAATTKRMTRSV